MAAAAAAAESGGVVDALGLDLEARKVPDPAGRAPNEVVVGWLFWVQAGFTSCGTVLPLQENYVRPRGEGLVPQRDARSTLLAGALVVGGAASRHG